MFTYQIFAQNSQGYFNIIEVTGNLITDSLGTRITDEGDRVLAQVPNTMLVIKKPISE